MSKYTWTAEGAKVKYLHQLEISNSNTILCKASMICINSHNAFCVLVTKYLLDYVVIVCGQDLLTPAVVLVFRGVWLGVWTASPWLSVLWAHRCPLLLAGGTTQKNTSPNSSVSRHTQDRCCPQPHNLDVSSHFLNLIHTSNSIADPRSVSRNNSVLLFLAQPWPFRHQPVSKTKHRAAMCKLLCKSAKWDSQNTDTVFTPRKIWSRFIEIQNLEIGSLHYLMLSRNVSGSKFYSTLIRSQKNEPHLKNQLSWGN